MERKISADSNGRSKRVTGSRVINNEPNVTETTKNHVLEAIETLVYKPSHSVRVIAGNET